MQKNNLSWQPSASIENLKHRAEIIKKIRDFLAEREILEVETPLLCHTSVTDPFIESIPAFVKLNPHAEEQKYYLQPSPEYAMKRLLAANYGAIYQMTKAFRQAEHGRLHNPEFTILEWYRIGFNHHALMDETDTLLQKILLTPPAEKKSYADLFQSILHINPHTVSIAALKSCIEKNNIYIKTPVNDRDTELQLLFTHCIESTLGQQRPCFVYDFPITQAALARIQTDSPATAARFEVYFRGVELANGFYELKDAHEQQQRFEKNLETRQHLGLPQLPIDEYFLAALTHGLPDCAGIALGIDRLVMLALGCNRIAEVISFDFAQV